MAEVRSSAGDTSLISASAENAQRSKRPMVETRSKTTPARYGVVEDRAYAIVPYESACEYFVLY